MKNAKLMQNRIAKKTRGIGERGKKIAEGARHKKQTKKEIRAASRIQKTVNLLLINILRTGLFLLIFFF